MTDRRSEVRRPIVGSMVITQGEESAALPLRDVSASAAYSPFALPDSINTNLKATVVLRSSTEHIIDDCVLMPFGRDNDRSGRTGVVVKRGNAFHTFLADVKAHPVPVARPESIVGYHRFLISKLLQSIESIEAREDRKNKFLVALCTMLVAVGIAPYVTDVNLPSSAVGFVGIFGLWGTGYAFYFIYQYLKLRGVGLKEKARYYRQICLSRSYLLGSEVDQWRYTVLPIGMGFPNYPRSSRQRWAGDWASPKYLSVFVAYIAAGLGLIGTWFVAHVVRALTGASTIDASILLTSSLLLAPFVPIAIQIFARACFYYHRAIAEAMRIRPEDPNPDLDIQPRFESLHKWVLVTILVVLYGGPTVVGVGCVARAMQSLPQTAPFLESCERHKMISVVVLAAVFVVHAYLKSRDVVSRILKGTERWKSR